MSVTRPVYLSVLMRRGGSVIVPILRMLVLCAPVSGKYWEPGEGCRGGWAP